MWRRRLELVPQTTLETYQTAREEVSDTPGRITSTVRAYSSVLVEQLNDGSVKSSEEVDFRLVSAFHVNSCTF